MANSNEWTEWHLTPRGWEEGSKKSDGAPNNPTIVEPPADRVLTYCYREYMSSGFSKLERGAALQWGDPKSDEAQGLLDQYGPPPEAIDMRDWAFQKEQQAQK